MTNPATNLDYYKNIVIDGSSTCLLKCPSCTRQNEDLSKIKLTNISLKDFEKISTNFKHITFSGTYSDPIYHPHFHELLEICLKNDNHIDICTNGYGRPKGWWTKTYELMEQLNNSHVLFALDGLPNESHIYRVGQNGNEVWEIMKYGTTFNVDIRWQYIIFNYNENHINEAHNMAKEYGIKFFTLKSSRWLFDGADKLKPSQGNYLENTKQNVGDFKKLYPKCISGRTQPMYSAEGYLLPCCFVSQQNDNKNDYMEKHIKTEYLKLSNIDDIKFEICNSEEWNELFDILTNRPDDAPDICKIRCGNKMEYKKYMELK